MGTIIEAEKIDPTVVNVCKFEASQIKTPRSINESQQCKQMSEFGAGKRGCDLERGTEVQLKQDVLKVGRNLSSMHGHGEGKLRRSHDAYMMKGVESYHCPLGANLEVILVRTIRSYE
jgi:hypothetical protein